MEMSNAGGLGKACIAAAYGQLRKADERTLPRGTEKGQASATETKLLGADGRGAKDMSCGIKAKLCEIARKPRSFNKPDPHHG